MKFKVIDSKVIHRGEIFSVRVDQVETESGNRTTREVADTQGASVIFALTEENKILVAEQFRYPHQKRMLELPAGKIDKGESPVQCALRELEEETGFKAGEIINLGELATSPGFTSEIIHLFLARKLEKGEENKGEWEKDLQIFYFSLKEFEDKIYSGEIVDAKTICAFFLAKNKLKE
jgi:ADP-ribose pyrophosphatase